LSFIHSGAWISLTAALHSGMFFWVYIFCLLYFERCW